MRSTWKTAAGTAAILVIPAPAAADSATDWWEVGHRFGLAQPVASVPTPPEMQRASARSALAMFEAVNAIDRRYESYVDFPVAEPTASQDAAAATAAYRVLLHHYPQHKSPLEESYVLAMAQIADGSAKEAGITVGYQAAQAVMTLGGVDAAIEPRPYRPVTTPGQWIGASLPSLEPYWATFKPWAVKDLEALMPPPPPPLGSATWARDYEEVRRLGGRASADRTPVQTLLARHRQGYDLSPMVRTIADGAGRRQVDNARLFALYQMAMDDAVQAMILAKQKYDFWRPITAIRNGDRDGNEATSAEAGWLPLLPSPNFQEYPCGHCAAVAVQAEVLKLAGGLPPSTRVRIGGMNPNMVTQSVESWDEAVRQVSDSRMLGGVHYRFSNDAGEEIGRKVARLVVADLLKPLRPVRRGK